MLEQLALLLHPSGLLVSEFTVAQPQFILVSRMEPVQVDVSVPHLLRAFLTSQMPGADSSSHLVTAPRSSDCSVFPFAAGKCFRSRFIYTYGCWWQGCPEYVTAFVILKGISAILKTWKRWCDCKICGLMFYRRISWLCNHTF